MNLLERYAAARLGIGDLETLRLVLRGESVIDWKRLHFRTIEEVDAFLHLNLVDLTDHEDEQRLRAVLREAVTYLRQTFRYAVAEVIAKPADIRDLFLIASGVKEARYRRIACVVLKVMHTVQHVDARELLFRSRISEVELAGMVDERVREAVVGLLRDGIPIGQFEGNTKARHSIITKLIAKREYLAATVYDRHRYRIVVESTDALLPTLMSLCERLFPFNHVIPGQTQNSLISLRDLVLDNPGLRSTADAMDRDLEDEGRAGRNEFSGRSYRVLNFIVDLPLRIDSTLLASRHEDDEDLGRVVFVPVELQLLDRATATRNEDGENSHNRYKKRQLRVVLSRLSRGLVVPKRRHHKPHAGPTDGGAGA